MVCYFKSQWLPTVLPSVGVPREIGAGGLALFQLGGTIGGLVLSRQLDKKGLMPVVILFLVSLPIVASIGYSVGSVPVLMMVLFLAGFCLLGLQFRIHATSPIIYPTTIPSDG